MTCDDDHFSEDIILADVIDSDSWRLWPAGDKRLQMDKQFYRDLPDVKPEDLQKLKEKFEAVSQMLEVSLFIFIINIKTHFFNF